MITTTPRYRPCHSWRKFPRRNYSKKGLPTAHPTTLSPLSTTTRLSIASRSKNFVTGVNAGRPFRPIHFKEDVLRVKRNRFRIVILSAAKDLCAGRDPSLRSELALERSEGMTK